MTYNSAHAENTYLIAVSTRMVKFCLESGKTTLLNVCLLFGNASGYSLTSAQLCGEENPLRTNIYMYNRRMTALYLYFQRTTDVMYLHLSFIVQFPEILVQNVIILIQYNCFYVC